jgi:hypothetical protein
MTMIDQERLKHLLSYDPRSGEFTWTNPTSNRVKAGHVAGSVEHMKTGDYLRVRIDGRLYQAHRLAVLYMTGSFPKDLADHKDGDSMNNKWANIHCVTSSGNNKNAKMRSNNTSGHNGVVWNKQQSKWQARVTSNGEVKHLGFFHNKDEAALARKEVDIAFGFSIRHGLAYFGGDE